MDRLLDAGSALPRPREWLVRENKWRAARYGVDADIVVTTDGDTRPLRAEVAGLVDDLAPVAARLGCADELEDVRGILGHGPSYLRQRAVVAGGGTLSDVVHHARRELLSDRPGV
jgi:carboxylate-amine ligase